MSKNTWQRISIVNLCETHVDCVNRTAPLADGPTEFKMIRTTNVRDGFIDVENVRYVDEPTFHRWTRRLLPRKHDVILTREAPLGEVGMLRSNDRIFLGQRLYHFRADPEKLDPHFLLYSLLGEDLQGQIRGFGSGSTVEHMRLGDIPELLINAPPIGTQRKIAGILSAYDDLIENNLRRIKILEEMAQSLYREWFVHFRFPGHESARFVDSELGQIPKGWGVSDLEKVTTKIGSGATPRGGKDSYKTDGITLIRSMNIYDYSFEFDNLAFIDPKQAAQLDNVSVEAQDVLLNITGASVCRCTMVPSYLLPARVNQHVAIIRANTELVDPHFLLDSINSEQNKKTFFSLAQGGATREALTKETICRFQILLPPRDLVFRYGRIAGAMHTQREGLHRKNQTLRRTRDLLLPQLLSSSDS
jgi:type I restriction enzyme S subunit